MAYKLVQARRHGGKQTRIRRIVIHATVSPCKKGGARNIANYFHTTNTPASAHYVVDPGEIIQCLPERTIGYHAPPNTGTIGIELCDPMKGSNSRWHDKDHEAMLKLAAKLVKEVAKEWDIPLKKIGQADLKAGRRGICGHRDVSNTWHMTDHTDPGSGFPWKHFMDLVGGAVVSGGGSRGSSARPAGPMSDGVLRQGESGSAIRDLQRDLNSLGAKPKLAVDGDYGAKTRAAVTAFQRKHKLLVDGIAGSQTLGAIKKALAGRTHTKASTTAIPAQSTKPATPAKSEKSEKSAKPPEKPKKPVKPEKPQEPVKSAEPAVKPEGPTAKPEVPAEPTVKPEEPAEPANAAEPAKLDGQENPQQPENPEQPQNLEEPEEPAKPAIDGIFGPPTTKALQAILNRYGAKLTVDGVFGPLTKKALQKYLKVIQDGVIGPVTVKALQQRLRTAVDGVWGQQTTRALQIALTAGKLDRRWWSTLLIGWLRTALGRHASR